MKSIDTLVEDIYSTLLDDVDPTTEVATAAIEAFGEAVKFELTNALVDRERGNNLRLSMIGKPDRQVYYNLRAEEKETFDGPTKLKFLYGHMVEALLIALVQISGHTVTNQQAELEIEGVLGHEDCDIDGELVDVKSASPYGFRKFKDGSITNGQDPFGYIAQLSAYAEAKGKERAFFLAIDKSSGEICLTPVDHMDMINANTRVKELKLIQDEGATIPSRCYSPVPDGSSGNYKLDTSCTFCSHKFKCWSDANGGVGLRTFRYGNGDRHLTTVAKIPKVEEVTGLDG